MSTPLEKYFLLEEAQKVTRLTRTLRRLQAGQGLLQQDVEGAPECSVCESSLACGGGIVGDAARLGWNNFFGLPLVPCLGEEEFVQVSLKDHAIQLVPGQGRTEPKMSWEKGLPGSCNQLTEADLRADVCGVTHTILTPVAWHGVPPCSPSGCILPQRVIEHAAKAELSESEPSFEVVPRWLPSLHGTRCRHPC